MDTKLYLKYQNVVCLLFELIEFDFNQKRTVSPELFTCYDQVLTFLKQDEKQQLIPHKKFVDVLQISTNYRCNDIFNLIDYYLISEKNDTSGFCIYMNYRLKRTNDIMLGVIYITKLLESEIDNLKHCINFNQLAKYVRHNLSSHTIIHNIYRIFLQNFKIIKYTSYLANMKYLADILYIMSKYIHIQNPFCVKELKEFRENLPFIKETINSYSENSRKEILYKHHLKKQYNYLNKKVNEMYWKYIYIKLQFNRNKKMMVFRYKNYQSQANVH